MRADIRYGVFVFASLYGCAAPEPLADASSDVAMSSRDAIPNGSLDGGDPCDIPDASDPSCATSPVEVTVFDSTRTSATNVIVHAYSGGREVARATTDMQGIARFALRRRGYRFEAVQRGLPAWSSDSDDCRVPDCNAITITFPNGDAHRAVTWDPYMEPAPTGGELHDHDHHFQRDGLYVEYWAIDHFGRPGAVLTDAHSHIGDLDWMTPGLYGNATNQENQHAFGDILQGFYVRLPDRGRFDLISLDYRIRRDDDPMHVTTLPDVDPDQVEILIATELDPSVPAVHPFTRHSIGRQDRPGTQFTTLWVEGFENVTGVFISSTGNVCFDDVVVRVR